MRACRWIPVLLLAAACDPGFRNPTTVETLRVLAVKAEPPEVLVDIPAVMATGMLPEPIPTITLTPLVVDPRGAGRPVGYRVFVCPNAPKDMIEGGTQRAGRVDDTVGEMPCEEGSLLIAEGTMAPNPDGTVPFTVMHQPTLPFLVQAAMSDPLGIELGLPIVFTFVITAGDERVTAFKRVIFAPKLDPNHKPNQNPEVDRIYFRVSRDQDKVPIDLANPPSLPPRGQLRISVEPAKAESYWARAFSLQSRSFYTEHVKEETLRYHFYATSGHFSPGSVNNDPSPLLNRPNLDHETTYEAGTTIGLIDVFVVVRDERAGSSFTRTRLIVE